MEFWVAGKEIMELAEELVAKYHSEIATASMIFLYRDKASPAEIESGQVAIVKRVTGVWNTLTEKDYVILVTYNLWNELSTIEQTAMLDSALESCIVKKDKDGEDKLNDDGSPEWAVKPHDIVGHSSIIARYGLDVFTKIGECVRSITTQPTAADAANESEYDDGEVTDGKSVPDAGRKGTRKVKAGSK
jgi:hypothetical protein